MKPVLLTMAKRPAAGRTKTRLAAALSPAQAADLYACFLKDTLVLMQQVAAKLPHIQLAIAYAPANEEAYFANLAPDFDLLAQTGPNLGERLAFVSDHYFQQGADQVVMINSDSPTLPIDYLVAAFQGLTDGSDVTLGPCDDGGYYAIGLKKPAPQLFREVPMSTGQVMSDTIAVAKANNLSVAMLSTWYDVDDADSLQRLWSEVGQTTDESAFYTRAFLSQTLGWSSTG